MKFENCLFIGAPSLVEYIFMRDISVFLGEMGIDVYIFEKADPSFENFITQVQHTLREKNIDVAFSFKNNFVMFNREKQRSRETIFEREKVPYISLNMDFPYIFLVTYLTDYRVMHNFLGCTYPDMQQFDLLQLIGNESLVYLPLSLPADLHYQPLECDGESEIVLLSAGMPMEIENIGYSNEFSSLLKKLTVLIKEAGSVKKEFLPDVLRDHFLGMRSVFEVANHLIYANVKDIEMVLKIEGVRFREIRCDMENPQSLSQMIPNVKAAIAPVNYLNARGVSLSDWLTLRLGRPVIYPRRGIWEGLPEGYAYDDMKSLIDIISKPKDDPFWEDLYRREVAIVNGEGTIKDNVMALCDWIASKEPLAS